MNPYQISGIYMISILTSEDARSIFTHVFPTNLERAKKITDLKDLLTSFIIAIGSGKDHQRDELTGLAAGDFKILIEWGSSLVGIFFVSSTWSLEKENRVREFMQHALREIELVYQGEIDQWLGGMGDLSIFRGASAILGRFFSENSLVRAKQVEAEELLQHPYTYYFEPTKGSHKFLPPYLESRGYRLFLAHQELSGETANAIVNGLLDGITPLHLILKLPPTPPEKIAALLAHLVSREAFNLFQLPTNDVDTFYNKLDAFLEGMKHRENLGPPANALYTSRVGDCFYYMWSKEKDCQTAEGEPTGCHGQVFKEGDCCRIFLDRLQTNNS